jgi:hypothetical protein
METSGHFFNDGPERLRAAITLEIEDDVRADFAQRLANASFLQRLKLRVAIRREIRRRLNQAASPTALY